MTPPATQFGPVEPHSFRELHARWPDVPGPGRAQFFDTYSARARAACWADLRRVADGQTEFDNELAGRLREPYCPRCKDRTRVHEPGAGCHQPVRRSTTAMSTKPGRVALSPGDDPLKAVPPRVYFEAVAGIVVPPSGRVSCPTPEHEDRHPSCTVTETHWRCWSCGAGGSIIDFGAAMYGLRPTGKGYHEIRRRLLADLGLAGRTA